MRRFNPPFNGYRYLLNKNTGEIHDLDNETPNCRIDKIKPEHIQMGDSLFSCSLVAKSYNCPNNDGCYYCLSEKDSG